MIRNVDRLLKAVAQFDQYRHTVRSGETLEGIVRNRFPQIRISKTEMQEITDMLVMFNNKRSNKLREGERLNLFTPAEIRVLLRDMRSPLSV